MPAPARNGRFPPAILKSGGPGRSTALVFAEGRARVPSLVVKASRAPAADASVVREHGNLLQVRSRDSAFLRAGTPEPVALEWDAGRPSLTLAARGSAVRLKDRPLREYLAPVRAEGTLLRATAWLTRFAREFGFGAVTLDDGELERRFAAPIDRYLRELRPGGREERALREWAGRAGALRGLELPLPPAHGDFCPANVLDDGGEWLVIDWETFQPAALPLSDLFHFLASLDWVRASGELRGNRGRNFSVAFLSDGPYRGAIDRCLRRACADLAVPPAALDLLFLVHWVEAALRKLEHLREQGLDPLAPGAGDFDDAVPVVRFRSGSCENVRDSLERGQRLPWRAWDGAHVG